MRPLLFALLLASSIAFSGCGLLLEEGLGAPRDSGVLRDGAADAVADGATDAARDGAPDDAGGDAGCVSVPEQCGNGLDDDCDGDIDEECVCDAYVLADAEGGGDGTAPEMPLASIQAAIDVVAAVGGGRVCVAASVQTGSCANTQYREAILMADGVDVLGGYDPESWTVADGCQTIIDPRSTSTFPAAVTFSSGTSAATTLSNFLVRGADGDGASMGVQFFGGGRLAGVRVKGGDSTQTTAVSVDPGSSELVEITGGYIEGPRSSTASASFGLSIYQRRVQVSDVDHIHGGSARGEAYAIYATDADGLRVENVRSIESFDSGRAEAIQLYGGRDLSIAGGAEILGGTGTISSRAISIFGSQDVRITDIEQIHGGIAPDVHGVYVENLAGVTLDGVGELLGRRYPAVSPRRPSHGLLCDASQCEVLRSSIEGAAAGTGPDRAIGVGFYEGAQGRVFDSDIASNRAGGTGEGVYVSRSVRVDVEANRFSEVDGATARNTAIRFVGTDGRIFNNFARTEGPAVALVIADVDGIASRVEVWSNTIVASGPAGGTTWATSSSLVSFDGISGDGAPQVGFRDNIFLCGDGAALVHGLTFSVGARPEEFSHNIVHGCDSLWKIGSNSYTLARFAAIPGATGFFRNQFTDPDITADGHLRAGSPAIGNAMAPGTLVYDYDGDLRADFGPPDIGCDEHTGL